MRDWIHRERWPDFLFWNPPPSTSYRHRCIRVGSLISGYHMPYHILMLLAQYRDSERHDSHESADIPILSPRGGSRPCQSPFSMQYRSNAVFYNMQYFCRSYRVQLLKDPSSHLPTDFEKHAEVKHCSASQFHGVSELRLSPSASPTHHCRRQATAMARNPCHQRQFHKHCRSDHRRWYIWNVRRY